MLPVSVLHSTTHVAPELSCLWVQAPVFHLETGEDGVTGSLS